MNTSPKLIDVREYPEFAAAHIADSSLIPLAALAHAAHTWDRSDPLVLVCKSGRRAQLAFDQLTALGFLRLSVLPGGIDAWAKAGKPLARLPHAPWSMERQVRFAAGSLILLTMALSFAVSRYFLALTALVGSGLVFAGASDICMMASLLGKLPWNRRPTEAA